MLSIFPLQFSLLGRAGTIWGAPVGLGYNRTYMNRELFFWIKRLKGPLLPLRVVPSPQPSQRQPNLVGLLQQQQQQQSLIASSSAISPVSSGSPHSFYKEADSQSSFDGGPSPAALSFLLQHSDSIKKGVSKDFDNSNISPNSLNLRNAWGKATPLTREPESSESESEVKTRKMEEAENQLIDKNPSYRLFCWSGFGHDSDVVRLGQVGRLRNSWDIKRRKKLSYEIIANRVQNNRSLRRDGGTSQTTMGSDDPAADNDCCNFANPLAPVYSSSEESHTGIIENQSRYRKKSKIANKLIKKQKASILELRKSLKSEAAAASPSSASPSTSKSTTAEQRRARREYELLSNLYVHQLGPFEPAEDTKKKLIKSEFPGSPISAYEEKISLVSSTVPNNRPDFGVSLKEKLGIHEERWTDLSQKKRRVRGIESSADGRAFTAAAASSTSSSVSLPMGFMGLGTDLSGSEYQLVGIDTNEFNRRFAHNKVFSKNLHGYESVLKGR